MTGGQQQLFRSSESYTGMVNEALRAEGDLSLQAEVYHLRAGEKKAQRLAQEEVLACQAYHRQHQINDLAMRRLASANAHG